MKKTIGRVKFGFIVMLLGAAGCATPHTPDSVTPKSDSVAPKTEATTLQGSWKGQEVGVTPERSASLVLSGTNLEFHGAQADDWCKGTFSLREDTNPKQFIGVITDGPDPQYVGKTVNAIYRLEDGTLTITGNPPGNPALPAAFDAPGARQLVFKAEQP